MTAFWVLDIFVYFLPNFATLTIHTYHSMLFFVGVGVWWRIDSGVWYFDYLIKYFFWEI